MRTGSDRSSFRKVGGYYFWDWVIWRTHTVCSWFALEMSAPRSKKTPEADNHVEQHQQQDSKKQRHPDSRNAAMSTSKLAPSLKALINAPFARPGQAPAPRHIRDVYARIAREAREHGYGDRPWITLSVSLPLPPFPSHH